MHFLQFGGTGSGVVEASGEIEMDFKALHLNIHLSYRSRETAKPYIECYPIALHWPQSPVIPYLELIKLCFIPEPPKGHGRLGEHDEGTRKVPDRGPRVGSFLDLLYVCVCLSVCTV